VNKNGVENNVVSVIIVGHLSLHEYDMNSHVVNNVVSVIIVGHLSLHEYDMNSHVVKQSREVIWKCFQA